MKEFYTNPNTQTTVFSNIKIPKSYSDECDKGYVYLLAIGSPASNKIKIGTTCNPEQRFKQHIRKNGGYNQNIYVLWISPVYSWITTLKVEKDMKKLWRQNSDWEYQRNDRFLIPEGINEITIKVKKEYKINIK